MVQLGKHQQTHRQSPGKSVESQSPVKEPFICWIGTLSVFLLWVLQFSTNSLQHHIFSPIIDSHFTEPHFKNVAWPLSPAPTKSMVETEENETGTNLLLSLSPPWVLLRSLPSAELLSQLMTGHYGALVTFSHMHGMILNLTVTVDKTNECVHVFW